MKKINLNQIRKFIREEFDPRDHAAINLLVDLASVNNTAAFALGLLRAFSGTRVRMAEDLSELYAESFGHA